MRILALIILTQNGRYFCPFKFVELMVISYDMLNLNLMFLVIEVLVVFVLTYDIMLYR